LPKESIVVVGIECTDCITRLKGEQLREAILERLDNIEPEEVIQIDFGGVVYMTPSFADECFGRLSEYLGREAFRQKLRLVNAGSLIRSVVNAVIANRLARSKD
jgi:hypothetical protein